MGRGCERLMSAIAPFQRTRERLREPTTEVVSKLLGRCVWQLGLSYLRICLGQAAEQRSDASTAFASFPSMDATVATA